MYSKRVFLLSKLEDHLDSDVLLLCNNLKDYSALEYEMIDVLRRVLKCPTRHENLVIILQTFGGDGMMAYFAVEMLREYYRKISVYTIGDCYSAGTILAFQADEIYMGRNACLGPIDSQFYGSRDSGKPDWFPSLQSNVNTLIKAEESGKITPFLKKTFAKRMDILACYFRSQNSDDDLFKDSLKRHCNPDLFEESWKYMIGEANWHGVPITFKQACKMGFDIKRIPMETEALIFSLVRDAENQFGELVHSTPMNMWIEALKKASEKEELEAAEGKKKSRKKNKDEQMFIDYYKYLSLIETTKVGFISYEKYAMFMAPKSGGGRPVLTLAITEYGWQEEQGYAQISKDVFEKYNEVTNFLLEEKARSKGIKLSEANEATIYSLNEELKADIGNNVLEEAQNKGIDYDILSSAEKQEFMIKLLLEMNEEAEADARRVELMYVAAQEKAEAQGIDLNSFSGEDSDEFVYAMLDELLELARIAKGISEEEFEKLGEQERRAVLVWYLEEKYGNVEIKYVDDDENDD